MKRSSLARFFVLMFLEVVAANMVHPVTPTFLTQLQMPEFMFGAAFAAMSLTNFLFCPFWGAVGDRVGRVRTLFITILGYAAGQILFLFGSTIWQILLARMVAGVFSGGVTVCFMAYVADTAAPEHCGRAMAVSAALTSAGTAIGYLAGGVLGDLSVAASFWGQFVILCVTALGVLLLLADGEHYISKKVSFAQALNPLSVFSRGKGHFTKPMLVFLAGVFLACFASTAYDNAFNYFLKDQFSFPPSYNGFIYAAIGVVGITFNMTAGLWIQRRTTCYLPLAVIFLMAGATLLASIGIDQEGPYILVNMVFYLCNSMYLPLQQALAIRQWRDQNGTVSGVFSSVRAASMVTGALFAGALYEVAPRLPMWVCAAIFFATALVAFYNMLQYRRNLA